MALTVDTREYPRRRPWRLGSRYGLVAAVWLFLLAAVLAVVVELDLQDANTSFYHRTVDVAHYVGSRMRINESFLDGFAALVGTMATLDEPTLRSYLRQTVGGEAEAPVFAVAERVPRSRVAALEAERRESGLQGFRVRAAGTGEDLGSGPPAEKASYLPVVFGEGESPEVAGLLGLDLDSSPRFQRLVAESERLGGAVASEPFDLSRAERAYLLLRPAGSPSGGPALAGVPRGRYALLLIRPASLLPALAYGPGMRSVLYHRDFASDDPQGELYRAGLLRRSWVERVLFPGLEHQEAPGRATQPFLLVTTWQLGWTELRWKVLAVISGTALASFLVSLVYARLYHTRQMERLAEADRLFRLANYDGLTGLPNRNLFLDRLRQALAKARRERRDLSVLFVDLDGFKAVNDTYGHDVGDEILRLSGERIRGCLRESDTVARRSGDELVVLLESAGGRAQAARLGEKVEDAFRAPFPVGGHEVPVGASVGYASFPEDGSDPAALLRAADGSMYARKAERQALARRVAASSGAPGRRTA